MKPSKYQFMNVYKERGPDRRDGWGNFEPNQMTMDNWTGDVCKAIVFTNTETNKVLCVLLPQKKRLTVAAFKKALD